MCTKMMKLQHILLSLLMACLLIANCSAQKTNVGLVFEHTLKDLEKVFHLAVEKANENNEELKLHGVTTSIEPGNAFDTSKKLCKMLKHNLVAVVGPTTTFAAKHAMSICDAKELPFIDTRWDFKAQLPTINLHPEPSQLAIALKDLVVGLGWSSFTIIYESGEYLATVKELLQMYGTSGPTVTVRRYELDLNGDYRNVLRRIKYSGENSFVVVGGMDTLPELFLQAQQVGLVTGDFRYIVGNLDFQTIDLEPFQNSDVNITCFRLISPDNDNVLEVAKVLYETDEPYQNVSCPLTVNMALVYDGVQLLAETFQHVIFRAVPLNCNDDSTWDKGYTLVNYMKSFNIHGISGEIKLDHQGLRTEFELEVTELTVSGLQKIGTWKTNDGLNINRPAPPVVIEPDQRSLVNKSFVVITAISEPYGMLKDTAEKLEGNDQYEGFGIELIDELSKKLGFSYTFRIQEDNKYGNLDPVTKTWNGMILEIIEKRADMGITDLTMTSDRESGVDFTIPFMNLGIAILFRKPMKQPPQLFSFMSPFSGKVWMFLGLAYVSVSLSMFILSRISPTEWDNPYPCIEEPTELENQFTFVNCFWFSIGALLQQGTELAPKGLSTRAVASAWWFFTLILVSSYTANLAAFLTIESLSSPINNVEDLAENKGGVKYGAKVGGSTFTFFQDAQYPTYQRMFAYMREHPELMTSTNNEGVQRVENDNYAFLMESTTVEYNTERRCKVTQVGTLLDEKGYGIAMRKNWPYRDLLSQAILELQEQGVLSKMKTKWWNEKRGGGACTQGKSSEGAKGLGFPNLGGVYLVLVVGSALASVYGIVEWLWSVYSTARSNKVSFKSELMDEIRFILRCSVNTKTVKYPKNSSRSSSSSNKSKQRSTSSSVDSLPTEHLEEYKKHSVAEQGKLAKLK